MAQSEALARLDAADYAPQLRPRRGAEGHQHGEANELVRHLVPGVWLHAVRLAPAASTTMRLLTERRVERDLVRQK
jgi:hypothetical protein